MNRIALAAIVTRSAGIGNGHRDHLIPHLEISDPAAHLLHYAGIFVAQGNRHTMTVLLGQNVQIRTADTGSHYLHQQVVRARNGLFHLAQLY